MRAGTVLATILGAGLLGGLCLSIVRADAPGPHPGPAALNLVCYWDYDLGDYHHQRLYVGAEAAGGDLVAVPDLARAGKAACWTAGSAGCAPERATDGDPETYSIVPAAAANANDLPKDLGVGWDTPQTVSQVRASFYTPAYTPALDGQELQYWTGDDWAPLNCRLEGADSADWVWTCDPVTTTRVRLLVTRVSQMRLAVRTLAVFASPVVPRDATVRTAAVAFPPTVVAGPPTQPLALAVGSGQRLDLLSARGHLLWETDGAAPPLASGDLTGDRRAGLVAVTDGGLRAYDREGTALWEATLPRASAGSVTVLACADLDRDAKAEVIAGLSEGSLWAFDQGGRRRWQLAGTGQPVAFLLPVALPGKAGTALLAADATGAGRIVAADGKLLGTLALGTGGRLSALLVGDLEGDGQLEIISGGATGVRCQTWAGNVRWEALTGDETIGLALADLAGDQHPEVVAAGAGSQVTALDAAGKTVWQTAVTGPLHALAVGDLNGDQALEIVVTGTGRDLTVLDPRGRVLATLPATAGPAPATPCLGLLLADLDGPGDRDEIIATTGDAHLLVYRGVR